MATSKEQLVTSRRERARVAKVFEGQGRTHQEFKDECDINNIMRTWRRTGQVPHLGRGMPWYGDFENADDFQTAVNRVREAQDAFMALPSTIREYCGNDPARFLDALQDSDQLEDLEELGLRIGDADEAHTQSEAASPSKPESTPPMENPPAEGDSPK